MDVNSPVDSPMLQNHKEKSPFDFVLCSICLTAIHAKDLQSEDILCLDCKAEVKY
jgi:hypothetical protein